MKVKIILKAKKQFGGIEVGETLTLFNEIFNLDCGIAFFPIDKPQWDIVSYHLFTGLFDENGKEIYDGDKIKLKLLSGFWGEIYEEKIGVVKYEPKLGAYIVEWKDDEDSLIDNHRKLTTETTLYSEIIE